MKKLFLDTLSLCISFFGSATAALILGWGFAALFYEVLGGPWTDFGHWRSGNVAAVIGGVVGFISFIVIFRVVFFRLVAFMRREYLD